MIRGPAWGVVACNVETQCQNLNCPDHWGGPFGPKLMNHLVISFKHDLHKKVTFQDICSVDPLWEFTSLVFLLLRPFPSLTHA